MCIHSLYLKQNKRLFILKIYLNVYLNTVFLNNTVLSLLVNIKKKQDCLVNKSVCS